MIKHDQKIKKELLIFFIETSTPTKIKKCITSTASDLNQRLNIFKNTKIQTENVPKCAPYLKLYKSGLGISHVKRNIPLAKHIKKTVRPMYR